MVNGQWSMTFVCVCVVCARVDLLSAWRLNLCRCVCVFSAWHTHFVADFVVLEPVAVVADLLLCPDGHGDLRPHPVFFRGLLVARQSWRLPRRLQHPSSREYLVPPRTRLTTPRINLPVWCCSRNALGSGVICTGGDVVPSVGGGCGCCAIILVCPLLRRFRAVTPFVYGDDVQ